MSDELEPKVVRLPVPSRESRPEPPVAPDAIRQQRLRDEIEAMLESSLTDGEEKLPSSPPEPEWLPVVHSEPVTPPTPVPDTPPSSHRNAIECPQCDRWTWRATETCRWCGYHLFAHYERVEQERRDHHAAYLRERSERMRQRMAMWALGSFIAGFVLIGNSDRLPESLHQEGIGLGFLLLIGGGLVLKSMSDSRPS
ncbi:hypothetical protein [Coralloluteibacterium stylophorae]|uniref:Uncharacterized protein n=1 Tax=Coralloluteibacterium stylophorae TaxID=1776034 RepID=A0A8J7VWA7_9GAMM|nr:hypothetical protein [Coralloluteibacterium stylophorae]MBS7457926.1 hypothetical protein [Coralloluteibacterium stylophorae]